MTISKYPFQSVCCPSYGGVRLVESLVKMTEKRPGPAPGVRVIEVSVKRELTVLQYEPDTDTIFSQPPLISFKRDKNIRNFFVRSAFQTIVQPGIFKCARA